MERTKQLRHLENKIITLERERYKMQNDSEIKFDQS